MKPKIIKANSLNEHFTPERCFIFENWGLSTCDEKVSVARARVEPGGTTKAHHLKGIQEIYLISRGKGRVQIGNLAVTDVAEGDLVVIPAGTSQKMTNIGKSDLVFYCICTPPFTQECYCDEE